jgi:hypothetical protein
MASAFVLPRLAPVAALALALLVPRAASADEATIDMQPEAARPPPVVSMLPPPAKTHRRNEGVFAGGIILEIFSVPAAVGGPILAFVGTLQPSCDCADCSCPGAKWATPAGVVLTVAGVGGIVGGIAMIVYGSKSVPDADQPSPPVARKPPVQALVRPALGGASLEVHF